MTIWWNTMGRNKAMTKTMATKITRKTSNRSNQMMKSKSLMILRRVTTTTLVTRTKTQRRVVFTKQLEAAWTMVKRKQWLTVEQWQQHLITRKKVSQLQQLVTTNLTKVLERKNEPLLTSLRKLALGESSTMVSWFQTHRTRNNCNFRDGLLRMQPRKLEYPKKV